MFERFTDRARRVVVLAQEEARMLNHNYIGTEHILLGLLNDDQSVAVAALDGLGITLDASRQRVAEIIGVGESAPGGHIPFTPRSKKVLELSLREALQLGHNYIGPEHILLGLIHEGEGVGAQVLHQHGADVETVRERVTQLLSGRESDEPESVHFEVGAEAIMRTTATGESVPQPPRCPKCRGELPEALTFRTMEISEQDGEATREVVVVFCNRCGNALGAF